MILGVLLPVEITLTDREAKAVRVFKIPLSEICRDAVIAEINKNLEVRNIFMHLTPEAENQRLREQLANASEQLKRLQVIVPEMEIHR